MISLIIYYTFIDDVFDYLAYFINTYARIVKKKSCLKRVPSWKSLRCHDIELCLCVISSPYLVTLMSCMPWIPHLMPFESLCRWVLFLMPLDLYTLNITEQKQVNSENHRERQEAANDRIILRDRMAWCFTFFFKQKGRCFIDSTKTLEERAETGVSSWELYTFESGD